MARHAARISPRRALLRAGLTVTAAGAALGLAGAAAQAAQPSTATSDTDAPLLGAGTAATQGLTGAVTHSTIGAVSPLTSLQLDPLANTGVDPLDNAVGTQIADFKPLSTARVTDPITKGAALRDLPLIGKATGLLPG